MVAIALSGSDDRETSGRSISPPGSPTARSMPSVRIAGLVTTAAPVVLASLIPGPVQDRGWGRSTSSCAGWPSARLRGGDLGGHLVGRRGVRRASGHDRRGRHPVALNLLVPGMLTESWLDDEGDLDPFDHLLGNIPGGPARICRDVTEIRTLHRMERP